MAKRPFKLKACCKRRLSILLIVIGTILVLAGIIVMLVANGDGSPDVTTRDDNHPIVDSDDSTVVSEPAVKDESVSDEPEGEMNSEETKKQEVEEDEVTPDVKSFDMSITEFQSYSFNMLDGSEVLDETIPMFHTVTSISVKKGTNPKTEAPSDILHVILSAVPDREFSVVVLVSPMLTENTDTISETGSTEAVNSTNIRGANPDSIAGIQWLLTYADSAFKKTARSVDSSGEITPLDAEHFNIRFAGNEGAPDVEFFGPLGTEYFAVMIYDDTYMTLILPSAPQI